MNTYIVSILLEQFKGPDEAAHLYRFVFTHQPTAEDILQAFDLDPFIRGLDYRDEDRRRLRIGLESFGVPRLNYLSFIDEGSVNVCVPMISAEWAFNAQGRGGSRVGLRYGGITIQLKSLIDNKPVDTQTTVAKKPTRAKTTKERK